MERFARDNKHGQDAQTSKAIGILEQTYLRKLDLQKGDELPTRLELALASLTQQLRAAASLLASESHGIQLAFARN